MSGEQAKVAAGGLRRVYPRSTNRPSLDANLCSVDRLKAQDGRLNQVSFGGPNLRTGPLGNVINAASGPSVTDSMVETTTYIDLQGGSVTITLPDATNNEAQVDSTLGLFKSFIMLSPGTATITPSSSPLSAVTLSSVNQSCTLIWSGGAWGVSSGGAASNINYNTIHDAYMDVQLVSNAGPQTGLAARGGAFFVTSDGYAVTASHIVMNDPNDPLFGFADLYVTVYNANGTGVTRFIHVSPSDVIGIDGSADVGVFRVPGITNQNFFEWGDAKRLSRGEDIYVIGQPGGYESADLNKGQIRNPIYWDEFMYNQNVILINCGQGGNSGGPLINQHLQVVGIESFALADLTFTPPYSASVGVNYATTASLDAKYINGPPGMIQANTNNVALAIDGHVFGPADVGVTTILVKDGIADMTAGYLEYPDQKSNGTYMFTQLHGVGQPWQATRIAPFIQSSMPQHGSYITGVFIESLSGSANGRVGWRLVNSVTQIDNPRQDNVIFMSFSSIFPGQLPFFNGDVTGATSQTQAQTICDRLIAGDRLFPLPNPYLNVLRIYNQKGWLGCQFHPWIGQWPLLYNLKGFTPLPSSLSGALLNFINIGGGPPPIGYPIGAPPIGGPPYPPIEVGFCNFFSAPLGTLASLVNPGSVAYVITKVNGIAIGSQTNPGSEVPISNVLYANPPGTVVTIELTDVYSTTFVGTITFPVTLGEMPANLDFSLSTNISEPVGWVKKGRLCMKKHADKQLAPLPPNVVKLVKK